MTSTKSKYLTTSIIFITGILRDFLELNLNSSRWTNIAAAIVGFLPYPRYKHGFASIDGQFLIHGGQTDNGEKTVIGTMCIRHG